MTRCPTSAPDPTSRIALRALLRGHGFRPRRSLGQTFLVDANIVAKIVSAAQLTGREPVLEIGAGAGAVTRGLVPLSARLLAIEIDPKLVAILRQTLSPAVEVLQADVLATDLGRLLGDRSQDCWRVVANLPYAITGPAILRLLSSRSHLDRLVIMVQAEVADRIAAPPGTRQRGMLSVLAQAACEVGRAFRVRRTCFWPQPRVDSAILTLQVRRPPLVPSHLEDALTRVVKAGFSARRKTLLNALGAAPALDLGKEGARSLLASCAIDEGRRAETLTEAEFLDLARALAGEPAEASP